jgi:hypothetical protein
MCTCTVDQTFWGGVLTKKLKWVESMSNESAKDIIVRQRIMAARVRVSG